MRQQQLGLQARGFHTFLRKEIGAFLNSFEDGHGQKPKRSRLKAKGKKD
jgi:hypothetical protein